MGPPIYFATVEANNFKFGIQLGLEKELAKKQLLRPKLAGVRSRGASKTFGTPYLFLQPLKLASSNLLYNLGLGSSFPRNNFQDKNWPGSGQGSIEKIQDPYFFLQSLILQLQNWYTTSVWGVRYNNNCSTELGRGWLGYRSTSKIVGITYTVYHIPCTN